MLDSLSYFSFQPVFHDWCNQGHGMCYPVCGMVHIKETLLLIRKSSSCGFLSRYLNGPLPYVWRHITVNKNVLSAPLNKTFPSFLPWLWVMEIRVWVTEIRVWVTEISLTHGVDGTVLPGVPLHAVQTHEQAVAGEQRHPHEHVPAAGRALVRQEDEANCKHKQNHHTNRIITQTESSHKQNHHTNRIITQTESSHKQNHHTNRIITQTELSQTSNPCSGTIKPSHCKSLL